MTQEEIFELDELEQQKVIQSRSKNTMTSQHIQKERGFEARITVYGLGTMLGKKRYEIAYWLRGLASEIENNHENYTDGMFTAKFIRPKNIRVRKNVK